MHNTDARARPHTHTRRHTHTYGDTHTHTYAHARVDKNTNNISDIATAFNGRVLRLLWEIATAFRYDFTICVNCFEIIPVFAVRLDCFHTWPLFWDAEFLQSVSFSSRWCQFSQISFSVLDSSPTFLVNVCVASTSSWLRIHCLEKKLKRP